MLDHYRDEAAAGGSDASMITIADMSKPLYAARHYSSPVDRREVVSI